MQTRRLGRSNIEVSPLGLGCWAIGGVYTFADEDVRRQIGWGAVDDADSVRAIQRALDLGVTLFDTADVYGCGHSERVLGQALGARRPQVVLATKFGMIFAEETSTTFAQRRRPITLQDINQALEASLRRLNTDYIDLYQFHDGEYPPQEAAPIVDALEELVSAGKIRCYAWSTDNPDAARAFAQGKHCSAVQFKLHVLEDAPEMLALCQAADLAGLIKKPLASGFLSGKYGPDATFPPGDIRHGADLRSGPLAERLLQVDDLRETLTQGGRSLVQGALAWLWARSELVLPIPGFKTEAQVEDSAGAMAHGPLSPEQMAQVDQILGRHIYDAPG